MAPIFYPGFILHFIAIQSILFFTSATSTGFTLPLIPPFSPESPFYQQNLTEEQQFSKLFTQLDHLNNVQLRVTNIPPSLFVTKLVLGTPAKTQVLLLDTGSSITWTQCRQCFDQSPVPIFNPNQSSSYQRVPCGSSCAPPFKCENGVCRYVMEYIGGASSRGTVSIDTFSFNERHVKLVFGCGDDNRNMTFQGKGVSGILGMDEFRHSLVKQLLSPNRRRFSYCLTTGLNKSSLLRFGDGAALRPGSGVGSVPFIQKDISTHYYLNLVDISVGTQRLRFPPGTFQLRRDGSGGCFIDSGTAATALDEGPYHRVMAEFDRYFTSQGRRRLPTSGPLEFCYNYDPHKSLIKMTFHFDRSVDYVVETPSMYLVVPEKGYFCVVLRKARGSSVLGAWQQVNMRIVYDLTHQMLHFKHEDCSRDAL